MSDAFIVEEYLDLTTASPDLCMDGTPYEGKIGQVSQWALANALMDFEIGEQITLEDLQLAINKHLTQQTLDECVDSGRLVCVYDETDGSERYFTPEQAGVITS